MILISGDALSPGMNLANNIRNKCNLSVITETLRRSMRSQMREANRLNANYSIIIGEDEIKSNTAIIKNMQNGEQTVYSWRILYVHTAFDKSISSRHVYDW